MWKLGGKQKPEVDDGLDIEFSDVDTFHFAIHLRRPITITLPRA